MLFHEGAMAFAHYFRRLGYRPGEGMSLKEQARVGRELAKAVDEIIAFLGGHRRRHPQTRGRRSAPGGFSFPESPGTLAP
jgi:hypothetical protein